MDSILYIFGKKLIIIIIIIIKRKVEDVDVLLTLLCGRLAGANGGNV